VARRHASEHTAAASAHASTAMTGPTATRPRMFAAMTLVCAHGSMKKSGSTLRNGATPPVAAEAAIAVSADAAPAMAAGSGSKM